MSNNEYMREYMKRKKGICHICNNKLTDYELKFHKTICSECNKIPFERRKNWKNHYSQKVEQLTRN